MKPISFDPFSDRAARDVRNRLSSIFVGCLSGKDYSAVHREAGILLECYSESVYSDYIHDRLQRYRSVFEEIRDKSTRDPLRQSVAIWNAHLFFEVHEHIEGIWQDSKHAEKQALKGLIQAAGVFVHRERNHDAGADRLALKARALLQKYHEHLSFIGNLDDLIKALREPAAAPPELVLKP